MANSDKPYIAFRRHDIHKRRSEQWIINELAYNGGKDYIEARLSRFAAEPDIRFLGDSNHQGRRDRAFYQNHPKRVAGKLNQYVFQTAPNRTGIEEPYSTDIDLHGNGVNEFMQQVSLNLTKHGFCWVLVERPGPERNENGEPLTQSKAEKETRGDRVYWSIYEPAAVVDWYINPRGEIEWVLTEETQTVGTGPRQEPQKMKKRILWEPGQRTDMLIDGEDNITEEQTYTSMTNTQQFVLIGELADRSWWFDDLERTGRSIMDLQSAYDQSLFDTVYAQRVLPADAIQELINLRPKTTYDMATDMILSEQSPILETPETKGITRIIAPPSDLEMLRTETDSRKKELYEVVALGLQQETRVAKSGAALHWENIDPETALAERARKLEEAEKALRDKSRALDSSFPDYEAEYTKHFDLSDWNEDIKTLIEADSKATLPETAKRIIKRAVINRLTSIRGFEPTPEEQEQIEKEIEEMDLDTPEMQAIRQLSEANTGEPGPEEE